MNTTCKHCQDRCERGERVCADCRISLGIKSEREKRENSAARLAAEEAAWLAARTPEFLAKQKAQREYIAGLI